MRPQDRLIIALDYPRAEPALELARQIAGKVGMLKVGLTLFHAAGPDIIGTMRELGARVFYDAKLHDIPHQVAGAAEVVGKMGVAMFNVHALGGRAMMTAAKEGSARGAEQAGVPRPLVIAVTVLTSLDEQVVRGELGIAAELGELAVRLAVLAREAGLDGVVCSAGEVGRIKQACGPEFLTVVPGIRPMDSGVQDGGDDQARVATAHEARQAGADYVVVGRPVTRAADPRAAVDRIIAELAMGSGR